MMTDLELLLTLIKTRPVTSDVPAVNRAVGILRSFLEGEGVPCVTELWQGREILYASTRPGKVQDYLLNAHVDVVPAIRESQFEPTVEGDLIWGRGTGDCLGNTVCVARFLVEQLGKVSVGAVFSVDEETGGFSVAEMVARGYGARRAAMVLDGGWNNGNIVYAQKGILTVTLVAHGRGGHASRPWLLENPIDKLVIGYAKLLAAWKNPESGEVWENSMTPCIVEGGNSSNQVPEEARMTLNIRYVRDEDRETIFEFIRETTGLEIEIGRGCRPIASDPDSPELKRLAAIYSEVTGNPAKFVRMTGATDARHLVDLKIPVAITGLDGRGAHSAKEAVDFASFPLMLEVLRRFTRQ